MAGKVAEVFLQVRAHSAGTELSLPHMPSGGEGFSGEGMVTSRL